MRQLIAGNWKMHRLRGPATELAPPFTPALRAWHAIC